MSRAIPNRDASQSCASLNGLASFRDAPLKLFGSRKFAAGDMLTNVLHLELAPTGCTAECRADAARGSPMPD